MSISSDKITRIDERQRTRSYEIEVTSNELREEIPSENLEALNTIADWLEERNLDPNDSPMILDQLIEWGIFPFNVTTLLAMDAQNRYKNFADEQKKPNSQLHEKVIKPIYEDYLNANKAGKISEQEFINVMIYLDDLSGDGIWPLDFTCILDRLEENIYEICGVVAVADDDNDDNIDQVASCSTVCSAATASSTLKVSSTPSSAPAIGPSVAKNCFPADKAPVPVAKDHGTSSSSVNTKIHKKQTQK